MRGQLGQLDLAVVVRVALVQRLHQRVGEHAVALIALEGRLARAAPPSAPDGPVASCSRPIAASEAGASVRDFV